MNKKISITLDEAVYDGLYRTIGKGKISQFIEDLLRPHVLDTSLDAGYKAMAADQVRESEAMEWVKVTRNKYPPSQNYRSKFLRTH